MDSVKIHLVTPLLQKKKRVQDEICLSIERRGQETIKSYRLK